MALIRSPIFEFITVTDPTQSQMLLIAEQFVAMSCEIFSRGRRVKYHPVGEFHFRLRLVNPTVSARHEYILSLTGRRPLLIPSRKILSNPLESSFEASEYSNLRSHRDAVHHGNTNPDQAFPPEMFGVLVPSTVGQSEAVDATAEAQRHEHDPYQGFSLSPRSILGQGRGINPLAQYPVEMDIHMHELVDNSKTRLTDEIRSERGFSLALSY
jgi:hypothetical protein